MNKKEFAVFVAALKTFYPRENLLPNQQAAELWYRELTADRVDRIRAVKKHSGGNAVLKTHIR